MELSKIQKRNIKYVIKRTRFYDCSNDEDIEYLLLGYKCFQNLSDEMMKYCIDLVRGEM